MDYQIMFTFMLEMAGTIAFAASGAMVGAQRGMDIFGVCVLGVVTAVGGGATRDIILGIVPPGMFQDPLYTIVATVTSCIVFAVMYWKQELLEGGNRLVYDKVMLVMDTVGLGVFTVMGVDKGISQGYMGRTFFLVFLGTVTGVGGGLIRDMMAGVPPYIFVRHIYACASIVGAIDIQAVGRSAGHGDRNGSSDPDPVPGGTLPVESAETEKRIKKDMKSSGTFKE